MKMASRTQRQLNSKGSKVRHQDHQVHRPRNTKKYTDEVREGSIIPEGVGGMCEKRGEEETPHSSASVTVGDDEERLLCL